jgi:hypothetical protein
MSVGDRPLGEAEVNCSGIPGGSIIETMEQWDDIDVPSTAGRF